MSHVKPQPEGWVVPSTEPDMDTVRQDFITAYARTWACTEEYAESLLQHVELTAVERLVKEARSGTFKFSPDLVKESGASQEYAAGWNDGLVTLIALHDDDD